MKRNKLQDSIILGFATFAMFFGAGNLIFPAGIGAAAGTQWPIALLATTLVSVVLPLVALIAATKTSEGYEGICRPIGKWFYNLTFAFICIFIVTLANLPRTAATTHEMSIAPFFPNFPIQATVIIYFALALFFALDKNSMVDRIGKYVTPTLLIMMIIIIVKGFLTPLGTALPTGQTNVFGKTFIELYQTGDLYSGLMFSIIVVSAVIAKGYKESKERNDMMVRSSLVAGIAFFVIYGGLLVIGANANGVIGSGIDRTTRLTNVTNSLLGTFGEVALAIAVALACLSTAVALISLGADFFTGLSHNKISYKAWAIIICVVGSIIGSLGVENIINFAGPAFLTVFPAGIVLTIVALMGKFCPNRGAYKYSVVFALVCGAIDGLSALGVPGISKLTSWLPLASYGFAWVIPSVAGFIIGWIKYKIIPEKEAIA